MSARVRGRSVPRAPEQLRMALPPRQREVADLVSSGWDYQEVAQQLVLEPGTVADHIAAILSRLGFRSRTQIGV